jgi:hypothetical protein
MKRRAYCFIPPGSCYQYCIALRFGLDIDIPPGFCYQYCIAPRFGADIDIALRFATNIASLCDLAGYFI